MDPSQNEYLIGLDRQAYQDWLTRQKLLGKRVPIGQRATVGLGRFTNAMYPVPREVASQVDPETIKQARSQALIQMGLGMMAANQKGLGFGGAALYGLGQGQEAMKSGLGQAWAASRDRRQDEQLELQNKQYERMLKAQEGRDQWAREEAARAQGNWERNFTADEAYRRAQLEQGQQLTPYQAEALRLQTEAATLERRQQGRIATLVQKQNEYLAKGGKRGDAQWQTYQDAIDNLAGRAVDRSTGADPYLGAGAANPFDAAPPAPWDAPENVPRPPAAPAPAPTTQAPPAGLGAPSGRPLPEGAYRSTGEINEAIVGGASKAITKADNYTARLNQKALAALQGISWEEWRRRNGFPPP